MQWEFQLGTIDDLRQLSRRLKVPIDAAEDVSVLAQPVELDGISISNSLAVHPMEGCDGDAQGRPDKLTIRRYERFAAGGAGLLWAEAIAVVGEARANPRQLWLGDQSKDAFKALVDRAREHAARTMGKDHRPFIVAQLTHSGRYSRPEDAAHPIIPQRDPYRDALIPQRTPTPNGKSKIPADWPLVTDECLDELQYAYVEAARLAFEVGFDAVDIKSCHGYLINELLACHNRPGKYGGSFENRTRFLLEIIDKISADLGENLHIVRFREPNALPARNH